MDTSIKVHDLLQSTDVGSKLAKSISHADRDGDGNLTVKELLQVFAGELSAKKKAARLKKIIVGLTIFSLVMLAANAGLTAAVVTLTKDTSVTNNVMMVKGTNNPVGVAQVGGGFAMEGGLESVMQRRGELQKAESIAFAIGATNYTLKVCGSSVNDARKEVLVFTCSGLVLAMTSDGPGFWLTKMDDVMAAGMTANVSRLLSAAALVAAYPETDIGAGDDFGASAGSAPGTNGTLARPAGRRLLEGEAPCEGCRRWTDTMCGVNICRSCKSGRFCSQIIPIETDSVADMISSSALIYRPDILDNPNVPYFY